MLSALIPCPLAGAMSSILCAPSRTVSAQEKRKCNGVKPKPPT